MLEDDAEEEVDLANVDYMALMRQEEEKKNESKQKHVEPQLEKDESIDEADVDEANLEMNKNEVSESMDQEEAEDRQGDSPRDAYGDDQV